MSKLYVYAASEKNEGELAENIRKVFLEATGNLSWLSAGQTVLLKPALNSADPYPATTHPLALKAVAAAIGERGGKVIVADQSGLDHVMQTPKGIIKGSTEECYKESGMSQSGLEFTAIEGLGWEEGFYKFRSDEASSWPDGFYVSKVVRDADHVVSLPRLSTHVQAGVTLGFKNMVGLLREDSRSEFHADGPFYREFVKMAGGTGLPEYAGRGRFFEKMTEISLATKDKLRLTLIAGTKAQLTFGPDGVVYGFKAHVVRPEPGLILASENQAAIEAAAIAYMSVLYRSVPLYRKALYSILFMLNKQIRKMGTYGPWEHPFVKRALELGLGSRDFKAEYRGVPQGLQDEISGLLKE